MLIADYVAELRRQILHTPHVVSHSLGYEERPPIGAIVKGSVTFADGSCLHLKEFLKLRPTTTRLKYAYHFVTPDQALIFRYDNARDPAAKGLSTYPDHRHDPGRLSSSPGPSLPAVLHEAAANVRRSHPWGLSKP